MQLCLLTCVPVADVLGKLHCICVQRVLDALSQGWRWSNLNHLQHHAAQQEGSKSSSN
jgi:hypothetical protein